MKTSRALRQEEWIHLKALLAQGHLLLQSEKRRWKILNREFERKEGHPDESLQAS